MVTRVMANKISCCCILSNPIFGFCYDFDGVRCAPKYCFNLLSQSFIVHLNHIFVRIRMTRLSRKRYEGVGMLHEFDVEFLCLPNGQQIRY